jgi:hypothetical protein
MTGVFFFCASLYIFGYMHSCMTAFSARSDASGFLGFYGIDARFPFYV